MNRRTVSTDIITKNIKEMCIEANLELAEDVSSRIVLAEEKESSKLGKQVLTDLKKNLAIAKEESIPICQDTGMAVVFLEVGQGICLEGAPLNDAVNEGVRQGYKEGYLRKSVVSDPLLRVNSQDNTPAIIHTSIVPGDTIRIVVAPKGFGSENMSRIRMLKPSDGIEGVKAAVVETVKEAGPNACPPLVVGVGIGGDFEECALLAKKALTRSLDRNDESEKTRPEHIVKLEREILAEINALKIGPAGFGGDITALGVNIETYPTHIAGLPVAVNLCCHVNRHVERII